MLNATSPTPFDLTGEFGGIVFTNFGKRRLLLRLGEGQERLLKVPRPLRRRMIGNFRLGQTIRLGGTEERDFLTGASKWVVSTVLPVGGDAQFTPPPTAATLLGTTIRVCAKKNCWRQGGCEVFSALERGLAARGLDGEIRVKAVGCLDRCKQGPNVDWGEHEFSRCTARTVEGILAQFGANPPQASVSQPRENALSSNL